MALDIDNYLNRITALQRTVTGSNTHASKVVFYRQSDYPYWTNHVGITTPTQFSATEFAYEITVTMRLHRGLVNEGEDTQLETVCLADIPSVLNAFLTNRLLTVDTYTEPQAGFAPGTLRITSDGVVAIPSGASEDMGSQYSLLWVHYEEE